MTLRRTLGATLTAAALLGCTVGLEPTTTAWQGELLPTGQSDLTGSVGVVSEGGRSEASIVISGAAADSVYTWDLRNGGCEQTGEVLAGPAVYPTLEPDSSGNASAQTVISESLGTGGSYSARVRYASGTADVACADLESSD